MQVNPSKFQSMVMNRNAIITNLPINVGDVEIEPAMYVKLLGMYIDCHLNSVLLYTITVMSFRLEKLQKRVLKYVYNVSYVELLQIAGNKSLFAVIFKVLHNTMPPMSSHLFEYMIL